TGGQRGDEKMSSIAKIVARARGDADVVAVFLFGSRARCESTANSDTDICLMLRPGKYEPSDLLSKRLGYLKEGEADVSMFSQLPLYIRHRVLREGKVLFSRDEDLLYEIAFRTAQAFEDFKHIYYGYLEEVSGARP
ncbi:MAG: nucleotidyltransferase domain-containing protein, partial [Dehalococcoidia bacterium]